MIKKNKSFIEHVTNDFQSSFILQDSNVDFPSGLCSKNNQEGKLNIRNKELYQIRPFTFELL